MNLESIVEELIKDTKSGEIKWKPGPPFCSAVAEHKGLKLYAGLDCPSFSIQGSGDYEENDKVGELCQAVMKEMSKNRKETTK